MAEEGANNFLKKASEFIDKRTNLILLVILAFAFAIRLKYMNVNAAVWWDEADYLSLAKHYGLGLPEQAAPWRARGVSMILGVFYFLGANEWFIRLIEAVVSVVGVLFTYKIGTLYNKTVGLVAALGLAVYFEYLFWTARISMDVYALTITISILWLFWKGHVEGKGWKYTAGAGALLGFGPFGYESIAVVYPIIGVFLLLTERFSFLKKKTFWAFAVTAIIFTIPFLVYNQVSLGHVYPRFYNQEEAAKQHKLGSFWNPTTSDLFSKLLDYPKYFPYYLKWPFFVAFIIGLTVFVNLFIGFDLLLKGDSKLKRDALIFIWGLFFLIFASCIHTFTGFEFEPRFLFPMMPVVFVIVGCGLQNIYIFTKKYNASIAITVIIAILALGIYSQLTFAQKLIDFKKDTYRAEKEAGLWLKEHSQPGETLVGCGQTVQIIYYSERNFISFGGNATRAEELIEKYKPKYFLMDGHDPACTLNYPAMHPDKFKPKEVFFLDKEKTKPIMIIYEAL